MDLVWLREAWLSALCSGDFKQGTRFLRTGKDEYDPFGVLCNLALDYGEWQMLETVNGPKSYCYLFGREGSGKTPVEDFSSTQPPAKLLFDIGVTPEQMTTIWKMNDIEHLSFTQIAEWIKTNVFK